MHTWNLVRMSKCFFMSVPSTWVMAHLRDSLTSAGDIDWGCRSPATTAWQVVMYDLCCKSCVYMHVGGDRCEGSMTFDSLSKPSKLPTWASDDLMLTMSL